MLGLRFVSQVFYAWFCRIERILHHLTPPTSSSLGFYSHDDGKVLPTSVSGWDIRARLAKVNVTFCRLSRMFAGPCSGIRDRLAKVNVSFSRLSRRRAGPCSGILASKPHLLSELSTPLLLEGHHHQPDLHRPK